MNWTVSHSYAPSNSFSFSGMNRTVSVLLCCILYHPRGHDPQLVNSYIKMCISEFPVVFFSSVPHRLHSVTSIVYLFLHFFHCNGLHGWIAPLSSHDFLGFPKETSLPLTEWFLPHTDNVLNAYNYWVKQRRKYVFCRLKRSFKRISWRADRLLYHHLKYHHTLMTYERLWRRW